MKNYFLNGYEVQVWGPSPDGYEWRVLTVDGVQVATGFDSTFAETMDHARQIILTNMEALQHATV